jgi:hypothetical protein
LYRNALRMLPPGCAQRGEENKRKGQFRARAKGKGKKKKKKRARTAPPHAS